MNLLAGYAVRRAASIFQALQRPTIPLFHLYTVWRLTLRRIATSVTLFLCPLPYPLMKAGSLLPIYILPRTARCGSKEGDAAPLAPERCRERPRPPQTRKTGPQRPQAPERCGKGRPQPRQAAPRRAALPKMRRAASDTVGKRPRCSPYALRVASTAFSPLMFHSLT